ncbi:MAG: FAD-binding protein [Actinobacteria bacterium]|uniref:Cholesterol oxidase n=1 Tax=freshwater metagenome TaxID=449393 RepID=A0A6J6MT92_9ZZZZ|nr:FAD-binding protein [Actinomycetota bacterium]
MSDYDVAIVGSGFGGSIAALRLTEKGYRVLVIEAGSRYRDEDFAKNSFDLKRFLFFPRLGLRGIQRIDFLRNVMVMSGAGVGGGSLVYANTLYRPPTTFYKTGSWAKVADWQKLLDPYFNQAERMLGVEMNPFESNSDRAIKKVADRMGFGKTYCMTPLGIFFGAKKKLAEGTEVEDPYFGGKGPSRTSCINCGECMTGCRHGAKNTLVKNYLYLAESAGAQVIADTMVTDIQEVNGGSYLISTRNSSSVGIIRPERFTADQVIVAAGALGTAKLLQKVRANGRLAGMSDQLGALSRTNSESLLGVVSRRDDIDFSEGSAITSSVFPDEHTHIEPVRYGHGSGFMAIMESVLASGKRGEAPTPLRLLGATLRNLHRMPKFYNLRKWPQRTLILLVMQARDNSLTTFVKTTIFGRKKLTSRQGYGETNPAWVKAGHDFARELARDVDGTPGAVTTEPFGIPMTAHFLGGCVIGANENEGVVDGYLRAFGQPGLHIFDGSTLSANPGVNPSLSIAAQAEWAAAHWPNIGEADRRPKLGAKFRVVEPVEPKNPVVPKRASGALRLPVSIKS